MDNGITMDTMISVLGQLGESARPEEADQCKAAINILFALSEEGAKTPAEAMDIIHDYQLQAKQIARVNRKHLVEGKPFHKDGAWHCPDCNRRVTPNHSFCHCCGKKLGWR